jgi:hypothetical protein
MNGKRSWKFVALGALTVAAWGFPARARAEAGALDGRTFVVQTGQEGKPAEAAADEIAFRDGKLRSSGCDPYGFGDGAYTTMDHGGSIMFRARTDSAKEGVIMWNGTVRGDDLQGQYVWTKPGQKPITYWMKGTLKQ